MKQIGTALVVLLLLGGAVLGHVLMTREPNSPLSVAVLLGPMVVLTSLWLWTLSTWHRAAAVGLLALLLWAVWATGQGALKTEALYVAQHAGIHAALAVWFFGTLRTGSVPLIERVALRVHALSPAMAAYARGLTRLWGWYFVVMVVLSLTLYIAAPFSTWAWFANVITPLAVVVLFVGEYFARYRLHPEFERATLRQAVEAWRRGDAKS